MSHRIFLLSRSGKTFKTSGARSKNITEYSALKNTFKLYIVCLFKGRVSHTSHVSAEVLSDFIVSCCILACSKSSSIIQSVEQISLNFICTLCHFITPPWCQAGQLTINSCLLRPVHPVLPHNSDLHLQAFFFYCSGSSIPSAVV